MIISKVFSLNISDVSAQQTNIFYISFQKLFAQTTEQDNGETEKKPSNTNKAIPLIIFFFAKISL